jgi:hypothetical protein
MSSIFIPIPFQNSEVHKIEDVVNTAYEALIAIAAGRPEVIESMTIDNWKPTQRQNLANSYQLDPKNTWKIYKTSKGFKLFSYYGEDEIARRIIRMVVK